jgi:hypothetical protein
MLEFVLLPNLINFLHSIIIIKIWKTFKITLILIIGYQKEKLDRQDLETSYLKQMQMTKSNLTQMIQEELNKKSLI